MQLPSHMQRQRQLMPLHPPIRWGDVSSHCAITQGYIVALRGAYRPNYAVRFLLSKPHGVQGTRVQLYEPMVAH